MLAGGFDGVGSADPHPLFVGVRGPDGEAQEDRARAVQPERRAAIGGEVAPLAAQASQESRGGLAAKTRSGDVLTVRFAELAPSGNGLARAGDRAIEVPGAVPGDLAQIRIVRRRRGRCEGVMLQLVDSAVSRTPSRCSHSGACGGCCWQGIEYADQLRLKQTLFETAMARVAGSMPPVEPILASPAAFGYRNKMEFSFGADGAGELVLGLHRRGRYRAVVDVENCQLQSDAANDLLSSVRQQARRLRLPAYDLRSHEGLLRFLVLRCSSHTGQVLANLVVAEYPSADVDRLIGAVLDGIPAVSSVVVTRHQGKAQTAVGQAEFVVHGTGRITESCNGVEYSISARSFFQTNTKQAAALYRTVAEMARDVTRCRVLDVYCGAGGISLQLARCATSVVAVECVGEAIADAWLNAERNQIRNCRFVAGQAEDVLGGLRSEGFDLAVVDPPRVGLHPNVRAHLIAMSVPRLIYVSCNPQSLADDLVVLTAAGYRLERIRPLDMFPQTSHCEAVVQLAR